MRFDFNTQLSIYMSHCKYDHVNLEENWMESGAVWLEFAVLGSQFSPNQTETKPDSIHFLLNFNVYMVKFVVWEERNVKIDDVYSLQTTPDSIHFLVNFKTRCLREPAVRRIREVDSVGQLPTKTSSDAQIKGLNLETTLWCEEWISVVTNICWY